jgi:integrase
VASGARYGEATALKPGDVDLAEGTVRIQRAWRNVPKKGYQLGLPKTKRSIRTIDMASSVLANLDQSGTWIFTNPEHGWRAIFG